MKMFVLEVGRPVRSDVESQIGKVDDFISIPRAISEVEIPKIVSDAYKKIAKLASTGDEVAVVLSGPLALAFELGQVIGIGHYKIVVYQYSGGKYVKVPPITREMLF